MAGMVVGCGVITLRLAGNRSLKGKRKVVKSVIGKIRSHFNASVAETARNDEYEAAEIGLSLVSNSSQLANSKLDKIINFVDDMGVAEIMEYETELFHW